MVAENYRGSVTENFVGKTEVFLTRVRPLAAANSRHGLGLSEDWARVVAWMQYPEKVIAAVVASCPAYWYLSVGFTNM
jgi:hypothetical protein